MSEDILQSWLRAMRAGDFERAWRLNDEALAARGGRRFDHLLPRHEQPIWDGTPLGGRRVLVRCYHGLGDTIMFARYLPLLRRVASEVIVWVQPALIDLLRGAGRLLPLHDGTPEVEYDVDVEIMELAHAFRTVPADVPYLHAAPAPLPPAGKLRAGVVWQAGDWNPTRSIPFELMEPLLRYPGVEFYALQIDAPERGLVLDERRKTIRGTAELMRALDLVITVDTMTAHLAGALAVPVWTLLPHAADWRWMENRRDSPWYPTMRLFRQPDGGAWEPVIAEVAEELEALG